MIPGLMSSATPPLTTASPDLATDPALRVVTADAKRGQAGFGGYLRHLRWLAEHAPLVRMLARVQLRLTVRRSRLYYLWWLLDPVLDTALYAVLFLVIRASASGTSEVPLIAFLLAGIIPWRLTFGCWNAAGNVWATNRPLIEQLNFPHLVLLLSRFLTEAWLYLFALMILVVTCLFVGVGPAWWWLALPLWVLVHALTIIAFMPLIALVTAFSQDLLKLMPYALRLLFFGSPILYALEQLPEAIRPWVYLNPLTMLIETYRGLLLYGVAPSALSVLSYVAAMFGVLLVSSYLFVRFGSAMSRSVSRMY